MYSFGIQYYFSFCTLINDIDRGHTMTLCGASEIPLIDEAISNTENKAHHLPT